MIPHTTPLQPEEAALHAAILKTHDVCEALTDGNPAPLAKLAQATFGKKTCANADVFETVCAKRMLENCQSLFNASVALVRETVVGERLLEVESHHLLVGYAHLADADQSIPSSFLPPHVLTQAKTLEERIALAREKITQHARMAFAAGEALADMGESTMATVEARIDAAVHHSIADEPGDISMEDVQMRLIAHGNDHAAACMRVAKANLERAQLALAYMGARGNFENANATQRADTAVGASVCINRAAYMLSFGSGRRAALRRVLN